MKVLFVAHSGEISGGANRSLLSLMTGLREAYGVLPAVLLPEENSPMGRACAERSIPAYTVPYHSCCSVFDGTPRDILRVMKLLFAPALDLCAARRVNRTLPKDFDLIYTNDRMIIVGGYLARLRGVPHVWHVRCFSRQNGLTFPPFWYRRMEQYADRVVLVSEALKKDFENRLPAEKLRVIYNGLEPEKYLLRTRAPHAGFHFLLAGRITPAKGQMEAVRALAILVREYQADAYLSLAGQAPASDGPQYLKQLKALVREQGLENRVEFLGEVGEMQTLRSRMDAEAVCSVCEAFGRVTVEAMLAGLPVVGTASGGTAEIVVHGETGLLYPPGQPEELASQLYWLYAHPAEAARMGEAGRERALRCFPLTRTVETAAEVLHALC